MPSPEITPGRPLRLYSEDGTCWDASTDTLVGEKLNNFKDWVCSVGTNNLFVDMDGQVWGASCRVGGKLGNVYEDFETPKTWLKCHMPACGCGADQFVPKAKDENAKSLLVNTFKSSKEFQKVEGPTESWSALEPSDPRLAKQVYWEIGRRCNFECTYCFPGISNKTDPHKSLEELIRASMLVEERFCKGDPTHFVVSGGEPTINPAFMDWAKFLTSMGHLMSMHSNGSRNSDYYRELIHYTNLNISVHFEFFQENRLLKNVAAITEEKVARDNHGVGHLEIKLMMQPGDALKVVEFEKKLLEIPHFTDYCTWAIVPIRVGDYGTLVADGYTESDYQLFGDRSV